MEPVHSLEISITLLLQALGAWLVAPMEVLSFFGQEQFYLLLLPLVYWCVDATIGLRLGAIFLIMQFSNTWFKLVFRQPRPFWIDDRVKALSVETSFGFPSGHSQSAVGIWGFLGSLYRRRAVVIGAVALILLIGLSRIYLGMHFSSDVLGGWLIGGLLLWTFFKLEPRITAWVIQLSYPKQIWLAAGSSLAIVAITILAASFWPGWQMPSGWSMTAEQVSPGIQIDALSLEGAFTIAGTWLGFFAGAAWIWHYRGKPAPAKIPLHRFWRYLIGAAGVILFWSGLGAIFSGVQGVPGFALRYFRYTLVGLWVSALAPLVFTRIGIGGHNRPPS